MSLRRETPCDFGPCPYDSGTNDCCEYWCGADEPEDNPLEWEFGCLIPFPDEPEDWEKHSGYSYPQSCPPAPANEILGWDE